MSKSSCSYCDLNYCEYYYHYYLNLSGNEVTGASGLELAAARLLATVTTTTVIILE